MKIHNKNLRISLAAVGFGFLVCIALAGFYVYSIRNGMFGEDVNKATTPKVVDETSVPYTHDSTMPNVPIETILAENFSVEYEVPQEKVKVVMEKSTSEFAKGKVTLPDEPEMNFIAVNIGGGTWVEAYVGNEEPLCTDMVQYEVPADYAATCFDEKTEQIVTRK